MMFTLLVLSAYIWTIAGSSYNFMDCPNRSWFWQQLSRRCCRSDALPNNCECFDISDESDFTNTPLHKPKCPEDLGVSFLLYTSSDRSGTEIKVGDLSSLFDGNKDTKVIIHGFKSNAFKEDFLGIMNAFLDKEDLNVILVNWEKGAESFNYYQCAANTRSVGAMTARLIQELHNIKDASYQSFHLIGHSLGAHVCGIVGKEIQRMTSPSESLGRISGLDPAGPLFENCSANVRLDKSDAIFVDVIHTNADDAAHAGFGIHLSVGHVDFYPNGGQRQPGCPVKTFSTWNIFTIINNIGCSHKRVTKLYKDSINRCTPRADDMCPMGYHAKPSCRNDYWPNTSETEPFCVEYE